MSYRITENDRVLVERWNVFYCNGRYYKGLVDPYEEDKDKGKGEGYDHPDDSINKAMGLPTDLETGVIYEDANVVGKFLSSVNPLLVSLREHAITIGVPAHA